MSKKPSSHEILTPAGIAVHCLHSKIVPAAELKLFPGNLDSYAEQAVAIRSATENTQTELTLETP